MHLFPSGSPWPRAYTLPNNVAAVHVSKDSKLSAFLIELPRGAQVELCGAGYNERTVEVRLDGEFYVVYAQDIELDGASK